MSMKLKVLGLGLLAMLATTAFAAINASATTTGTFAHHSFDAHAFVEGRESGTHRLWFSVDGGTPISCDQATYHGTVASKEFSTLDVLPTFSKCHTEGEGAGSTPGAIVVDVNGCNLRFHSNSAASGPSPTGHATAGIVCPAGVGGIAVTHPNCTMRVPPQAFTGFTYAPITGENGAAAITFNATVQDITAHYEGGICVFLGTTHRLDKSGSVTVEGTSTEGKAIGITAK